MVDVQNRGVLPFLSENSVIETSCYVDHNSIVRNPLTSSPGPVLSPLLASVKAYETLAVQAALTGERTTALRALACNPITADLDQASPCLFEMLEQNRSMLPRFFPH